MKTYSYPDRVSFMIAGAPEASWLADIGTGTTVAGPHYDYQFVLAKDIVETIRNYPDHGFYGVQIIAGSQAHWYETKKQFTKAIDECKNRVLLEWKKEYESLKTQIEKLGATE